MNIKRVIEKDTRTAFEKIKQLYGEDTAILSNKKVGNQVEVVVAINLNDGSYSLQQDPEAAVGEVVSKPRPVVHDKADSAPTVEWMQARRSAEERQPKANTLSEKESIDQVRKLLEKTRAEQPKDSSHVASLQATEQPSLQSLAMEMSALRDMFQSHLEKESDERRASMGVFAKDMLRTLDEQGVIKHQVAKLQRSLTSIDDAEVFETSVNWFKQRLGTADINPVMDGGIFAFVGLSGVGKTTTIAKIASQAALVHGRDNVALITQDHNRIGSREQMNLFGMMLGVEVINSSNTRQLKECLNSVAHKKLVLIDTAGVGLRSDGLSVLADSLMEAHEHLQVILTLAANNQTAVNQKNCQDMKGKVCGTIVTKLDETLSCGGVVSSLIESSHSIIGASEGAEIPRCYNPMSGPELVNHWFEIPTSTISEESMSATRHESVA